MIGLYRKPYILNLYGYDVVIKMKVKTTTAQIEIRYEELEGAWRIFFITKDEELFNKIVDIFERSDLEAWSEDPWSSDEKAVFAVQITQKIRLYFVLKYNLRYVVVYFPDEIELEKTYEIERKIKEQFSAEIVERDNYVTVFEIEVKFVKDLKNYVEKYGCMADVMSCRICGEPAEKVLRTYNNIDYYCEKCYNNLP